MLIAIAAAALAAGQGVEVLSLAGGQASPPARVEDVAWLAGRWLGEGLGGCSEENISPPAGGQIMGMFRQTKSDGSLWFYEFFTIAQKDGSIVMRIKHFDPNMTGWEDKDSFVEFPLVSIERKAVYFDGLSYARDGRHGLKAAVRIGETDVGLFRLRRVKANEQCPSQARS